MNLKDFISSAIIDICEGVEEASEKIGEKVCPSLIYKETIKLKHGSAAGGVYVQEIEFDIAVTASNRADKSGSGKIEVLSFFKAGGDMSSQAQNSTASRIKFHVPLALINSEIDLTKKEERLV